METNIPSNFLQKCYNWCYYLQVTNRTSSQQRRMRRYGRTRYREHECIPAEIDILSRPEEVRSFFFLLHSFVNSDGTGLLRYPSAHFESRNGDYNNKDMVISKTAPASKEELAEKARLATWEEFEKAIGFSQVLKKITKSVTTRPVAFYRSRVTLVAYIGETCHRA